MVNLFQTIDSLQNSIDPLLTLEEKLGGSVKNDEISKAEESKEQSVSSGFGEENSSSEELEPSPFSLQEAEAEESEGMDASERSEQSEESKRSEASEESEKHFSATSPIGHSSRSPMESGEDLVSAYDIAESEEDNEGGSSTPEEPSDSSHEESSGYPQSSSYATARDVQIEESKVHGSSTTYKNFSESFGEEAQRPSLSSSQSSEEEEKVSVISSPFKNLLSKDSLEKESLLASKVGNPKTYIANISPKKDSPQDDSAPLNIMNKFVENTVKKAVERGKIEVKASLCFQKLTISVSEQFSREYQATNRNRHRKENRKRLEKIEFLELILEELTVNYTQSKILLVTAEIKRLFARDTQIKENGEKLIPHPYDMIICNPLIELANEDTDEESSDKEIKQLSMRYTQKGEKQDINFVLTNMRFTLAPQTIEQFVKFKVKIDNLQKEAVQREINRKKKVNDIERSFAGPSENIDESENLSQFGRNLPDRLGEIHGSGRSPKRIFEEKEVKLEEERKLIKEEREKKESSKTRFDTKIFKITTNIFGTIIGVEVWTPLDPTNKDSRVLSSSLGADVRMRTVSQMLTKFDKFKQILVMSMI